MTREEKAKAYAAKVLKDHERDGLPTSFKQEAKRMEDAYLAGMKEARGLFYAANGIKEFPL